MKNLLTRRREQRILETLRAIGPMDEWELYRLLNAYQGTLNKALLSLAVDGQIASKQVYNSLWLEHRREWRIADGGEGDG